MRVLICGGRDFDRIDVFSRVMGAIEGDLEIISGMAPGADTMAVEFAEAYNYPVHKFPADWDQYGKKAGPIRNQQMIDEGLPDLGIAFPTKRSRGTYDMIRRLEKAGVKTIVVKPD